MHRHSWTLLVLGLGTAALGACKKAPPPPPPSEATTPPEPPAPPPFAVKTIDVGKGITADKHVANSTTTFGVRDTIYASVLTDGAGNYALQFNGPYTAVSCAGKDYLITVYPSSGYRGAEAHVACGAFTSTINFALSPPV